MKKKSTRLLCMAAIFTALVFVVTAYLHIPTNNGYIHVGDGLIYLAACMLPWPYAVAVGAGGALLADCLTGFAVWAPASVIIKSVTALLFTSKSKRIMGMRNRLMLLPAAVFLRGRILSLRGCSVRQLDLSPCRNSCLSYPLVNELRPFHRHGHCL